MRYQAVFVSDVHLGTRGCQAEKFLQFLKDHPTDQLFLVGDIVDGWRMRRGIYWPESHNQVLRHILKISQSDTEVVYITGNHDEFLRAYTHDPLSLGGVRVKDQCLYISDQGERYLILHGDQFDGLLRKKFQWLSHLGASAYEFLIWFNLRFNRVRRWLGLPYWSLSTYLKHRTKQAVNYMNNFEINLANYARKTNYDGVICGHIHCAEIKNINGIRYVNCGDWVESCSGVVVDQDGRMSLVNYAD